MQNKQIGGSALTNSHHEQMFQSGQQRVPYKYYQNIKNKLDAYKKLHIQGQEARDLNWKGILTKRTL